MKKMLLTIAGLCAVNSVALADATSDYVRHINKIEGMVKVAVAIQYDCQGDAQSKGRVGFALFDRQHMANPYASTMDKTNPETLLLASTLIPTSMPNRPVTTDEQEVLNFMPEKISGFRAVNGDKTEDLLLTLDSSVETAVGFNMVMIGKEPTEEVVLKGTLTHIVHNKNQFETQKCDVVIHKCQTDFTQKQFTNYCTDRVSMHNYHAPFTVLRLSDLAK
jgi:hypothetical protein